ncbi:MAG: DEAD/DEAH box helicase [Synergistaceae bacterium]|nr:DEAD/DEAH box helicase [Synergistaceae bacterium]
MLYKWQISALEKLGVLKNKLQDGIISAPTGSGKTVVAYVWAGLLDINLQPIFPTKRVIFTAPIKALSSERYMDLKKKGFDVGLETGDFKKNEKAKILCCTQEIYTLKYSSLPEQMVVIDEFHYIFNDSSRTRAYIDAFRRTPCDSRMLVMSATFGEASIVKSYLSTMARREFVLFNTNERATALVFKDRGIRPQYIHDALVFAFSKKGVEYVANLIAKSRRRLAKQSSDRLFEIANILEVDEIPATYFRGVGMYYGSMLPKEKLFTETSFRERIIDVVAGTDALSLGVNFPVETVVFAQMAKLIDGPLTKNEFLQMSGRAGRKGYFNTGYVTYLPGSKCENFSYDTANLYLNTLHKPQELAKITIHPSMNKLLTGNATIEMEAKVISNCSLPEVSFKKALKIVSQNLRELDLELLFIKDKNKRKILKKILGEIWSDEIELEQNVQVAELFYSHDVATSWQLLSIFEKTERNRLQALLKVKRFTSHLPSNYSIVKLQEIDEEINKIDSSVFGFEDKIELIDASINKSY